MKISGFIWLEQIVEKLSRKHNVLPQEVEEVFQRSPKFRFVEKGYRPDENVYAALGQTVAGRYLIIFFVYKSNSKALILSARDMDDAERKRYRQQ